MRNWLLFVKPTSVNSPLKKKIQGEITEQRPWILKVPMLSNGKDYFQLFIVAMIIVSDIGSYFIENILCIWSSIDPVLNVSSNYIEVHWLVFMLDLASFSVWYFFVCFQVFIINFIKFKLKNKCAYNGNMIYTTHLFSFFFQFPYTEFISTLPTFVIKFFFFLNKL